MLYKGSKFTPTNKNIWITVKSTDHIIQLIVKDEGLGFKADELSKVYRPFQRLSANPTNGESSTGLGLSIVYQIVQLHGGAIYLESEGTNKGSSFTVNIPKSEPS